MTDILLEAGLNMPLVLLKSCRHLINHTNRDLINVQKTMTAKNP